MDDLIIAELLYITDFNIILLCVIGFLFFISLFDGGGKKTGISRLYFLVSFGMLIFSVCYIGGRDLNIGVDTASYHFMYEYGESVFEGSDTFYNIFALLFSKIVSFRFFLCVCAVIYIGAALLAFYRIFEERFIFSFILFLISPYFFQFGINVMRNGMAASIFLLALSYDLPDKKNVRMFWFLAFISFGFHFSMLLPIVTYFTAKKLRLHFWVLIIALFVSFGVGLSGITFFEDIFYRITNIFSEKISAYFLERAETQRAFRDYYIHLLPTVLLGVYFIGIKNTKDVFYESLFRMYGYVNVVYFMIINIYFSIRFAYLFAFLMPILLVYPIIKSKPKMQLHPAVLFFLFAALLSIKIFKN